MQFYRDNHTAHRLPSLRLTNIIDKATEFPQLRGKVVKAASTRAIVPFLSHFAGQLDCTTTFGKHRLKMVRWLERIYEVMYESPMFLTSAQAPPPTFCSNHKLAKAKAKANYDQRPLAGYPARKAGRAVMIPGGIMES